MKRTIIFLIGVLFAFNAVSAKNINAHKLQGTFECSLKDYVQYIIDDYESMSSEDQDFYRSIMEGLKISLTIKKNTIFLDLTGELSALMKVEDKDNTFPITSKIVIKEDKIYTFNDDTGELDDYVQVKALDYNYNRIEITTFDTDETTLQSKATVTFVLNRVKK